MVFFGEAFHGADACFAPVKGGVENAEPLKAEVFSVDVDDERKNDDEGNSRCRVEGNHACFADRMLNKRFPLIRNHLLVAKDI